MSSLFCKQSALTFESGGSKLEDADQHHGTMFFWVANIDNIHHLVPLIGYRC